MSSFDLLSLPPELIGKIVEHLPDAHKKPLRLVCHDLDGIVSRQLFSRIVLKYSNYQPDLLPAQLEALATRSTSIRKYVRSLEIRGFSPDSHLGVRSRSRSMERNSRGSRSRSRGPLAEEHVVNRGLLAHLGLAICSLTKVESVWWQFGLNDPEWAKSVVMDSLAALPHLSAIKISLGGGSAASLRLEQLTNLRHITITGSCPFYRELIIPGLRTLIHSSPNLQSLEVDSGSYRVDTETCTLHDLLTDITVDSDTGTDSSTSKSSRSRATRSVIPPLNLERLALRGWCVRLDEHTLPHLRFLKSLSLYETLHPHHNVVTDLSDEARASLLERITPYSSTPSEVFEALREASIRISSLSTDAVCPSLLTYLASYSGLKKVVLTGADGPSGTKEESERLADTFYVDVLPLHRDTLEVLEIEPRFEGGWCFNAKNKETIGELKNLRSLKLAVRGAEVGIPATSPSREPRGRDRAKPKDAVWNLLDTTTSLPSLTHLTISSTESDVSRYSSAASVLSPASYGHLYRVNREISKSVTTFGPLDEGIEEANENEEGGERAPDASESTPTRPSRSAVQHRVITTPARDYVPRYDKERGGVWFRSSMMQGSHLEL
ncbi:hypothetical protein CVT24_004224 [Panaeolus cyanescens]|uniref:F-box domain-containing protein n=1 Tax=Panaeolus cyanescens TaxID=181874 RepID=A0A409YSR3_9AGAR|nr:hypothetical protein CVT24_004224 [Panaeolus cyanescens]